MGSKRNRNNKFYAKSRNVVDNLKTKEVNKNPKLKGNGDWMGDLKNTLTPYRGNYTKSER